jgi:hypothetical protein
MPRRDSNPGLPYSKPTRYYLSRTAPVPFYCNVETGFVVDSGLPTVGRGHL